MRTPGVLARKTFPAWRARAKAEKPRMTSFRRRFFLSSSFFFSFLNKES
jgi:hypothetical protein